MGELSLVHRQNNLQPVNTLPTELLCFIFELAHETAADPLKFSSVCEQWRAIALFLPSLWKVVAISATNYDATLEYLRRSAGSLLDVAITDATISFPDTGRDNLPQTSLDSLVLLAGANTRIRSIEITMRQNFAQLWACLNFPAPNLVKFECHGFVPFVYQCRLPETLFMDSAPLLRSVALHNMCNDFCNFKDLENLHLCSNGVRIHDDVFFGILNACPQLKSLEIDRLAFIHGGWVSPQVTAPHIPDHVLLASLTHISLINTEILYILAKLMTPNLEQLIIRLTLNVDADMWLLRPISTLESLSIEATQSQTRLQTLEVTLKIKGAIGTLTVGQTTAVSGHQLVELFQRITLTKVTHLTFGTGLQLLHRPSVRTLLRATPNVQRLTVAPGEQGESILKSLVSDDPAAELVCPDLEELSVHITTTSYQAIFSIIRDIVASRAEIGRIVRVGYILPSECGDLKQEWEQLCLTSGVTTSLKDGEENGIVTEEMFGVCRDCPA